MAAADWHEQSHLGSLAPNKARWQIIVLVCARLGLQTSLHSLIKKCLLGSNSFVDLCRNYQLKQTQLKDRYFAK